MMEKDSWTWRELSVRDLPDVVKLIEAVEAADEASIRTTPAEVASYFADTHVWRAMGAWTGKQLIAFGLARIAPESRDVTLSGGVAKEWRVRGLGGELLNMHLENARELAATVHPSPDSAIMYIEDTQKDLAELAAGYGFQQRTGFLQVRRDLSTLPGTVAMPSNYIDITVMRPEFENDVRKAHNDLLAEMLPWQKYSKSAWQQRIAALENNWCLVAFDRFGDRPKVAGYMLASRFTSAQNVRGVEGYVEEIGVLPEWRDRHIATGLLYRAMQLMRRDGMDYLGMDVDFSAVDRPADTILGVLARLEFETVSETRIVSHPL